MYKLDYTITTLSPVIIAKNSGDPNMIATEEYISGSSILGALAGLYIHKKKISANAHKDEFFNNCFLRGDITFSNAYVCEDDASNAYIPSPFSMQRPKDDVERKTCYDLFYKELCESSKSTSYLGGFCNINGSLIKTCDVKRSIHFHHERDYNKGTTKSGVIFNYESIDAGQIFKGMLLAKNEEQLKGFAETFGGTLELTLGRSRTAQYGKVKIEFGKPTIFTATMPNADTDDDISVTFTSSTIILNEFGFPSVDIKTLQNALGEDVEIQNAFIKSEPYEGYSSVWRLKKPSEICIAAGSCLLIKTGTEAIKRLRALEFSGIGQRTNEGFGRFVLGMKQDNEKLSISQPEKVIKKPTTPMPETVKKISKSMIQDYLIKQASLKAINEAKKFSKNENNPPTKSLVSRLEAMIRKDGEMEIDELRKTAKNKLEGCDNGKVTLKSFLERQKDKVFDEEIKDSAKQQTSFLSEINYDPSTDEDIKDKLYRQYWLSFFAYMRKAIKAQKGGHAQ